MMRTGNYWKCGWVQLITLILFFGAKVDAADELTISEISGQKIEGNEDRSYRIVSVGMAKSTIVSLTLVNLDGEDLLSSFYSNVKARTIKRRGSNEMWENYLGIGDDAETMIWIQITPGKKAKIAEGAALQDIRSEFIESESLKELLESGRED